MRPKWEVYADETIKANTKPADQLEGKNLIQAEVAFAIARQCAAMAVVEVKQKVHDSNRIQTAALIMAEIGNAQSAEFAAKTAVERADALLLELSKPSKVIGEYMEQLMKQKESADAEG